MATIPTGKLSKHIVVALGVAMIVGLIAAFMLKYGGQNGGRGKMAAQRTAATIAAQVGSDTPESVADASTEIADADAKAKAVLQTEAQQTEAAARAQEQARTKKQAQAEYPHDKFPFETGTITAEQLAHYKAAKDALSKAFESVTHPSHGNTLPSSFDVGAGSGAAAATQEPAHGAVASGLASGNSSGNVPAGNAVRANSVHSSTPPADSSSAIESLRERLAKRETSFATGNTEGDGNAGMSSDIGGVASGSNSGGNSGGNAGGLATSQKLVQAMMQQQMGGQKQKVDANESWQQKQQKAAGVLRQPLTISAPPQTSMLQEGAVIPLVLMTALNNTLPGHVSARVTTNVYDSIHGDTLAIPAGSRLEGNYNEHTLFGQKRMMFAFDRIILPSGASIRIAAWNGSDAQGRAGVEGEIDNHLWEQFGTGLLLGVAGWLLQPNYPTSGVNISTGGGFGYSSMGDAAGQTTFQTASGILSQYQNMKPEVNVAAGSKLSLIVLQDISLTASGADPNAANQTDVNQASTNQASSNQGDHN